MQRVVVVAKDSKSLGTVRAVLGNPDCEVLETGDIEVGVELLREPKVGCLIVDCGIDGLTREMRHLLQYSAGVAGIPVLWITPYGAHEPLARELGLSRINLLPRPFTPLELLERVQESIWIGPYVPCVGPPAAMTL
jgi:DNA-binding response OmpR family regulator